MDFLCISFRRLLWCICRRILFRQVKSEVSRITNFLDDIFNEMHCHTVRLVSKLGVHSRLWLLFVCTLLAAPLAVGTLHFPPPGAFGNLYMSNQYFFYINDIIRMSDRLLFSCRDLVCCPLHSHCGNCSSRDQVNKSFLKCFRICQLIFG